MLIIFYCIVNIFLEFNNCKFCNEVCEKVVEEILWFGIEQEYIMLDVDKYLLGWFKNGFLGF